MCIFKKRNNKVFIVGDTTKELWRHKMHNMETLVESPWFFDRYGDVRFSDKYGKFGFVSVVPEYSGGKAKCFLRMLGCSYIYLSCGWHEDKCVRRCVAWAEILGKKVIFEEGSRCR